MNDVILKGLKAMKGHKFNTSLPFFIVRARKLDRFVDRSDINRNANYLVHEGDVFETFKDFSCGYNQLKLKKFDELVKEYKRKLIDNNGNEHFDENDSNVAEDNSSKEHEYVGEEQREQLERSLKEIEKNKDRISKRIEETKEFLYLKSENNKDYENQIKVLQKQFDLLERIMNLVASKIDNSTLHKNKPEIKVIQSGDFEERNIYFNEKRNEEIKEEDRANVMLNQNKKQTYQQKKNERFKMYKETKGYKSIKGIKSKNEEKQNKALMSAFKKSLNQNGEIDFKILFKAYKIWS